jgi:hypothetical protein
VGLVTCPHQNQISTRSIATHPCKKRKDGAPSVGMTPAKIVKGGPPAEVEGGHPTLDLLVERGHCTDHPPQLARG